MNEWEENDWLDELLDGRLARMGEELMRICQESLMNFINSFKAEEFNIPNNVKITPKNWKECQFECTEEDLYQLEPVGDEYYVPKPEPENFKKADDLVDMNMCPFYLDGGDEAEWVYRLVSMTRPN
jgi:hypothetical protein